MANSKSITLGPWYDGSQTLYMGITAEETSVDYINNLSKVLCTVSVWQSSGSLYHDYYVKASAGSTTLINESGSWSKQAFPAGAGSTSKTITVNHDANGNASLSLYIEGYLYVYSTKSGSGTLQLTSIDRSAPSVSFTVNERGINSIKITANSNVACNSWDYSIDGGNSWINFSSSSTTSVAVNITGLSVNQAYNIKVRARKTSNYIYGASGTQSVSTLGIAVGSNISARIGETINITWTRYVTSYVHTLTYKFGSVSGTIGTNLAGNVSWEVPMNLLYEIPNANSGTGTYTISTYNGSTLIGSNTYTLTLSAPESVKPQFNFTLSDIGQTQIPNAFIAGFSRIKATIDVTNINNLYGATIVSAKIKVGNNAEQTVNYSSDRPFEITSETINQNGPMNVTVSVIDSRNNRITRETSVYVYPFDRPSITDLSFAIGEGRCVIDIYGTISRLRINNRDNNAGYITLKGKRVSQSGYYIIISDYEIKQSDFITPNSDIGDFHITVIDENATYINSESYEYSVQLEDYVYYGSTAVPEYSEQTGVVCISRYAGGKGVAFFGEAFEDGIDYYLEDNYIARESLDKSEWEELYNLLGLEVSGNMFKLLDVLKNAGGSPVGSITQFAGSTAPNNWLICNGAAVSRTTYAKLFAVIGTTYGGGDGSTTFNLPNLVNRFPVGAGSSYGLGSAGGSTTSGGPSNNTSGSTAITTDQMPSHSHTLISRPMFWAAAGDSRFYQFDANITWTAGAFSYWPTADTYQPGYTGGNQGHTHTLSSHTHGATPPYLALNYIIKAR